MGEESLNSEAPVENSEDTKELKVVVQAEESTEAKIEPPKAPKKEIVMKQEGQKFKRDSWLNRNVQSILAILVLIFAFVFFKYVLSFDYSEESPLKGIVILLIGTVSTLVTVVISYFFGSSQGSSDKSKHMMNGKH